MSDADDARPDEPEADEAVFDEVREAAGAVIASLKQLIDATERVVADPAAFASAVDGGRSIVESFVGGFTGSVDPDGAGDDVAADGAPAESGESAPES